MADGRHNASRLSRLKALPKVAQMENIFTARCESERLYLCHQALEFQFLADPYRAQLHIILSSYAHTDTEYHLEEARKIVRHMEQIVASASTMDEDLEMLKQGIEIIRQVLPM